MTTGRHRTSTSVSTSTFRGSHGVDLAARLETPAHPPRATALFAHCFTCSKDLWVERRLTAALVAQGYAVLSFDFAGIGRSGGTLATSGFACDVSDLLAAADHLADAVAAPSLLVGHSLGGAAVLSAAPSLPSVRAVATIGAPADPQHVEGVLDGDLAAVRRTGAGVVQIAGRTVEISDAFLQQLASASPRDRLAELRGAVLLMHSPVDEVVGIDHAEQLYRAARHPKSYVSLERADHLLSRAADADYVAAVVAAWAGRYLEPSDGPDVEPGEPAAAGSYADAGAVATNRSGFLTTATSRGFALTLDEPASAGGGERGPTPYDHLATALAACTVMTMRSYAERKGWDVGELRAEVTHDRVHAADCETCDAHDSKVEVFDRRVVLPPGLTDDQVAGLTRIADRCPVHRTLRSRTKVASATVVDG